MTKSDALAVYLVSTVSWIICSAVLHGMLGPGVSEEMTYLISWCLVAVFVFNLPRHSGK